ncbi:MAG: DUF5054 domain-containing protein [Bacteroidales bacterium]|nr:DUF5054 domain-containing protein [Bacteroidales bacterium]
MLLVCSMFGQMQAQEINPEVEKVYVSFKTHLDVGFTDWSSIVTDRYVNEFIPKALDLTERLAAEETGDRYVWTTGSWLIWKYLQTASQDNVQRMEAAIRRGDIVWNAVPYTVESEALNEDVYDTMLLLAKKLDEKYGKNTIAAKMTDVPGHTRSIIRPMNRAGIEFLHIGVNPASQVPGVPEFCRWRDEEGNELVLVYQLDYGLESVLPGGKVAIAINFTGDNHGPHSYEEVKEIYAELRAKYPNARLVPGSFNEIAEEFRAVRDQLPVVTSEIGDTWIHGYASAPMRLAKFRALSSLYSQWLADGKIRKDSDEAVAFAVELAMVAEHTFGVDVKSHIKNWDIYDMDEFIAARKENDSFQYAEVSWAEQDAYIDAAVECLPGHLQNEAYAALAAVEAVSVPSLESAAAGDGGPWSQTLLKNGILNVTGLSYQTYDSGYYEDFFSRYLRARYGWALADFGKTGLEESEAVNADVQAKVVLSKTVKEKNGLRSVYELAFSGDDRLDERMLPAKVFMEIFEYDRGRKADISLTLVDKPAVRLPEAYWLSFDADDIVSLVAEKTGAEVDLMDVVEKGNRQMHGIDRYVDIVTSEGTVRIWSKEAFLVNVGEAKGLNYSTSYPDMQGGVHFNLSNNLWGTNFTMWNEGSMTYHFTVEYIR